MPELISKDCVSVRLSLQADLLQFPDRQPHHPVLPAQPCFRCIMNNFLVTIELTGRCNISCLHCLRDKTQNRKDLSFTLLSKIVKQLKKYNNPHIAVTGGEPTIHKDFFKILKLLSDNKFHYHFITNGYNFFKIYKRVFAFSGKGLDRICFSLDGANEPTHDKIRVKGSYKRVIEAIALCKAKEVPVSVQMVINRFNRHELHQLAYIGSKMGFEKLYFCHMQPSFSSSSYDVSLSPEEWLDVENEVRELQSVYTVPIVLSAGYYDETPISHCQFLQNGGLNINYQGELTFCCQLSNMFDSSGKKDIVANLNRTSLFTAHKRLLDRTNELNKKRIDALEKGKLGKLDFFHCWYCLKQFNKIEWIKVLKENEWAKADPGFKNRTKKKWKRTKQTNP